MVNAELAGWRVDRSHSAVVIYPPGYLACPFRKFELSFFRPFFILVGYRGVVIVPIELIIWLLLWLGRNLFRNSRAARYENARLHDRSSGETRVTCRPSPDPLGIATDYPMRATRFSHSVSKMRRTHAYRLKIRKVPHLRCEPPPPVPGISPRSRSDVPRSGNLPARKSRNLRRR